MFGKLLSGMSGQKDDEEKVANIVVGYLNFVKQKTRNSSLLKYLTKEPVKMTCQEFSAFSEDPIVAMQAGRTKFF
jgi:hypothetical protein